jgi:sigma54-dependent transcription regulator
VVPIARTTSYPAFSTLRFEACCERGAFTGVRASRPGKIEQAAGGGVLFLDELGEMTLVLQLQIGVLSGWILIGSRL